MTACRLYSLHRVFPVSYTHLQDLTIHGQLQALQHREQDELKAALRKYGTEVDGGFEAVSYTHL